LVAGQKSELHELSHKHQPFDRNKLKASFAHHYQISEKLLVLEIDLGLLKAASSDPEFAIGSLR
jgi:hypothetical protein